MLTTPPSPTMLPRAPRTFSRIANFLPLGPTAPQCTCLAQHVDAPSVHTVPESVPLSEVREVIRTSGQLETVVATSRAPGHHRPPAHVAHMSSSAAPVAVPSWDDRLSRQSPVELQSGQGSSRVHVLPSAAPVVRPMSDGQLQQLVEAMEGSQRVVAVTGAGCSTEAGIPDYRGPQGAYTRHGFKPMTHQQFMAGAAQRARYFARSFFGWHEFASSQPGGAHEGLARLVQNNWVSHIITQNVDRLHHKAGTPRDKVLELHGTTHEVRCLSCGTVTSRQDLQHRLAQLNPAAAELALQMQRQAAEAAAAEQERRRAELAADVQGVVSNARPSTEPPGAPEQLVPFRRPDGDVELRDAGQGFTVPPCDQCGGILKPEVVFFGDNIPLARTQRSLELASSADMLLVVGSSLMVWSAYRLVEACKKRGGRVVLVNVGVTRADPVADLKLEVLAGEAMMRAAAHPTLLLPRV